MSKARIGRRIIRNLLKLISHTGSYSEGNNHKHTAIYVHAVLLPFYAYAFTYIISVDSDLCGNKLTQWP